MHRADKLYDQSQSPGSIDDPQYSQPICTILQIALVDLLSSYSIKPSVVLGHSSGDIASAYCSGAISRESAWKIAYYRGLSVELAMKLHPSYGSMMAVSLKADRLENYLYLWNKSNPSRRHLVIACYNSATNFTISGDKDALQSLGDRLKADDVPHRMVNVGVAYHSTHMTETSVLYENLVHNLSSGPLDNDAPIHISTVTGRISTREQLQTTEYWVSNLIEPVQFHQALRQVCSPTKHESRHEPHDRSADYIIEIGPHAALKSAIKDTLGEFNRSVDSNYSSVLLRNKPADTSLLDCIGQIYSAGYPVNLTEVNKNNNSSKPQMLTKLPPYPFNHSRSYWLEGRLSTGYRRRKHPFHALLGTPAPDWNELEARWNHRLIRGAMTFLSEHKVSNFC
jgi:acyl transferase domain-containing protein